jgi:molecular chaperone DnaK (HSP70)
MSKSKANTSPELKTSVVGVDLGSAFTKIAAVEKGVVDIITNEANLRQTPTIVGYGSNERLIGEAGNVKLKSNLNNSIISPQRSLGV